MDKQLYQIPLLEEIPLGGLLEEPFCGGISGGGYNPKDDEYDDDSD